MVGIYGGGGSGVLGLSFRSWVIHFCLCTVVFACAQLSSLMCGRPHLCLSSLSFEQLWWTVSAGCSSCRLLGVVVSTGACRSWLIVVCGWRVVHGSHRYPGPGIVVCGWGIIICRWGITFHRWGLSLYVDGGAHCLLWFEHHGGHSSRWWHP